MLAAKKGKPVSAGITPPSTTVVLIHGLWTTPLAWEHWVDRYEARGCTVLTPGYPGIGQDEAGLRALRGDPELVAGIGVREVMDYLTKYIGKLDARPVIMGILSAARSRNSWSAAASGQQACPSMARA